MDVSDFLPNGFNLRKGAGGGDPKNGLCFMETVALIAGENVTDHPQCACPILTAYGIRLNDNFDDETRKKLLPLAWATAGTRSEEHERTRLEILGRAACDMALMVLPIYQDKNPGDMRVKNAIEAALAYWDSPTQDSASAAYADAAYAAASAAASDAAYAAASAAASAAAYAADAASAADAAYAASAAASAAAYAAAYAADAASAADAAYAAYDAASAAYAAASAASAAPQLKERINNIAIKALRDAIEAGPNGGFPDADVITRINAVREILPLEA